MPLTENEIMTLRDVCAYLRVHSSTINRLLKRKQIPAFKVGTDWRFNRTQIEQWTLLQIERERRIVNGR